MASTSSAADPVRLLQDLIRCASVTPTEAGVFDVLEEALAPLGFAVTRLRFEGTHLGTGLKVAYFAFGRNADLAAPMSRIAVHRIAWR